MAIAVLVATSLLLLRVKSLGSIVYCKPCDSSTYVCSGHISRDTTPLDILYACPEIMTEITGNQESSFTSEITIFVILKYINKSSINIKILVKS